MVPVTSTGQCWGSIHVRLGFAARRSKSQRGRFLRLLPALLGEVSGEGGASQDGRRRGQEARGTGLGQRVKVIPLRSRTENKIRWGTIRFSSLSSPGQLS